MVTSKQSSAVTGEWECMECGYIEEGEESSRPMSCPECNAPGSALEFFSYEDDDSAVPESGESGDEDYDDEDRDDEDSEDER
jgi:hypothetical protein